MDKLKDRMQDFLRVCRKNPQYVKTAVIALVVITALVFFGTKGEKEEIPVIQNGETLTQETSQTEEEEHLDPSGQAEQGDVATTAEPEAATFVVDLDGCVKNPGVYEIPEGTRLYEVIEMAGGLTKDANTTQINQAEVLCDGQKILIPEVYDEVQSMEGAGSSEGRNNGSVSSGKININTADAEALQEIPGVGPATAEKIIAYRESNGRFQTIEDIKNVSGIGEKTFEKMKDKIII